MSDVMKIKIRFFVTCWLIFTFCVTAMQMIPLSDYIRQCYAHQNNAYLLLLGPFAGFILAGLMILILPFHMKRHFRISGLPLNPDYMNLEHEREILLSCSIDDGFNMCKRILDYFKNHVIIREDRNDGSIQAFIIYPNKYRIQLKLTFKLEFLDAKQTKLHLKVQQASRFILIDRGKSLEVCTIITELLTGVYDLEGSIDTYPGKRLKTRDNYDARTVIFLIVFSLLIFAFPTLYSKFYPKSIKPHLDKKLNLARETNPKITPTDFGVVDITLMGLTDLDGIQEYLNIAHVSLSENSLHDLSPLAGLSHLNSAFLDDNLIADISPISGISSLETLNLRKNCLVDISPLANLQNLDHIYLSYNFISDITPLAKISKLRVVFLDDNRITDLSPLVDNLAFGDGCILHIYNNPLSEAAINVQVPELEKRGVTVLY